MTMRVGNVVIIEEESDRRCKLCGKVEECRPAGPKGEQVCYDCAFKDPAAMDRYAQRLFEGERQAMSQPTVALHLTRSQRMALIDILIAYLRSGDAQVFINASTDEETTAGQLLGLVSSLDDPNAQEPRTLQ